MSKPSEQDLEKMHVAAEERNLAFNYVKPEVIKAGKALVGLGKTDLFRSSVQVVKKNGGENNLHYHTNVDTFWMVLKGRVRFYGPGDVVLGEFGPLQGTITPRYSRYWFENVGDGDLELLQVAACANPAAESGRTDVSEQRLKIDTVEYH